MRTLARLTAATQFALILPAALFLTAVLVGAGDAPQYDLARVAHRIVMWYSARMWTLWLLLLILPFAVLVSGCATLLRSWKRDAATIPAPFATLVVAGTTLASAGTLAVVMLHMLAN
ncbi:MAG TPA: hypothetical protein VG297_18185 [Bryobacteraceae bacterium]|jgi:hypothetical protein|nr:hypothetical protein [Bryobacteraceae bacterium]